MSSRKKAAPSAAPEEDIDEEVFAEFEAHVARFVEQQTRLGQQLSLQARQLSSSQFAWPTRDPKELFRDMASSGMREIVATPSIPEMLETLVERLSPERKPETRGRKAKHGWARAVTAVFGRIYRGDVPEPKKQAEVEALLVEWFAWNDADEQPVESQIRDHARLIWREIQEAEN
jgi:hypothetical protein